MKSNRTFAIFVALILLVGGILSYSNIHLDWKVPNQFFKFSLPKSKSTDSISTPGEKVRIVTEESVVIDVVDKASPAVVTIGITKNRQTSSFYEIDPFNLFTPFQPKSGTTQKIEQDIGSGFIVGSDGLLVTNKHVVSDSEAKYRVITKDDKTYDVTKIYRDPTNDLAVLKINASNLPVVELGDSSKIKVGQLAIAIGTALGEFRSTVTTGVISGVGRGITAGSAFEGYAERLDNVIQTSAAINPGNSGGPLLNSSGQVIGVNTAVSQDAQNIGFALPINVVKEALDNFNQTGQFDRAYLGVRYKVVTKDVAIMNDMPEGDYLVEVVANSPAAQAGLEQGDVITKIDDIRLTGTNAEMSKIISQRKSGDVVRVTYWRDGKEKTVTVTLASQQG